MFLCLQKLSVAFQKPAQVASMCPTEAEVTSTWLSGVVHYDLSEELLYSHILPIPKFLMFRGKCLRRCKTFFFEK